MRRQPRTRVVPQKRGYRRVSLGQIQAVTAGNIHFHIVHVRGKSGTVEAGRPSRAARSVRRWTGLPAVAALTAATRSALRLRTRFVDVQASAIEFSAVEIADCAIPFVIAPHFDNRKPSGLARIAIRHNVYTVNGTVRFKHGTDGSFGRPEAEIPYKNVLHFGFPSEFAEQLIGQDRTKTVGPGNVGQCVNRRRWQRQLYHSTSG